MNGQQLKPGARVQIESKALGGLIEWLKVQGYLVIGPTIRDNAIILAPIDSLKDLPKGWKEEQEAGKYRLCRRDDGAYFGHTVGPQSWKRFLHPPEIRLFSATREGNAFKILNNEESIPRYAFLGVRGCDLAAIHVQDRVLLQDQFVDTIYRERRRDNFVVAIHCTQTAPTCFCTSMGTGPRVQGAFDLCLTELFQPQAHRFLVEIGSAKGTEAIKALEYTEASDDFCQQAGEAVNEAAASIQRKMETSGIRELIYRNLDSPHWNEIASRCLNCTNCTMVCPTCFCTTVQDTTDLTGAWAERWRKWDSCFNTEFSYIHGGSVRTSAQSRYRQWFVHKLASWHDQFGSSGCVGCGRCITWCPVGIDITEEARVFRKNENVHSASKGLESPQSLSP
ncbi:MAG: 4Fe-4S dicluster domain-containing protein [Terriglobia bacterium]